MSLISVPRSSRWVAKLWRSACSVTLFLIPASLAASSNRRRNWRGGHRRAGLTARKQPTFLKGRCGIETPAHLPPLPQQIERLRRQHNIAILAALGLLDANDLLRGVDLLDLQPDHLAATQAAAIAETEQHAGLEARGDGQQAPRLIRAHHQRDLLRLTDVIDRGGQIQSP